MNNSIWKIRPSLHQCITIKIIQPLLYITEEGEHRAI
ncbi:hypothetical protein COLO4_30420 [Corchorus olitorius]|uniref:Uncharacterized protein n=1 Tax=Corchorus olitorius TaxID=93759 RepID=A0A1R3H8M5_9ROSI|nr:hypothetical protein COLO4_30420 [Corchorus olitorius]